MTGMREVGHAWWRLSALQLNFVHLPTESQSLFTWRSTRRGGAFRRTSPSRTSAAIRLADLALAFLSGWRFFFGAMLAGCGRWPRRRSGTWYFFLGLLLSPPLAECRWFILDGWQVASGSLCWHLLGLSRRRRRSWAAKVCGLVLFCGLLAALGAWTSTGSWAAGTPAVSEVHLNFSAPFVEDSFNSSLGFPGEGPGAGLKSRR